ncbi:MAG: TIGR01777 family oxidoreductase [Frankia sp.]
MRSLRVAVAGSSGLIGSALGAALVADGHRVTVLVRPRPDATQDSDQVTTAGWDPASGVLDAADLVGVDAVVNLAGAGIADHRWTERYKRLVLDSRLQSTTLLAETIAGMRDGPQVLLSGSAVGWYGDTGAREVDETAPAGTGFLAEIVTAWEDATAAAEKAGVRVCHLRTGVVLSSRGGALGKQLPLFRLGIGGRLGSGRQYLSWISLLDEVAAIRRLLTADNVSGAVNVTAPTPVTNAVFTRELGAALHRPTPVPVPAFALRAALGGFADEGVLTGQRVQPRVLTDAGFPFTHTEIGPALRDMLVAGF